LNNNSRWSLLLFFNASNKFPMNNESGSKFIS